MRALATFAVATLVLAAAPAFAGPASTTEQVTVRLGDLDLSTAAGARAAVTRLNRAASEVCGERPGGADLIRLSDSFRRCRAEARRQALAQINAAVVDFAFAEADARPVRLTKR